jgi:phosphate transport system substrate-binding protein
MKKTLRRNLGVAIATIGLLSTVAVSVANAATLTGDLTFTSTDGLAAAASTINMGGSSFDEPFFNAAIPVYMSQAAKQSGASAPTGLALYSPTGSTAGKKGVVAGTYQVGASDVPMGTINKATGTSLDSSIITGAGPSTTLSNYVQIPVVLGGVGLMYNLPSVTKKFPKNPVILNAATLAGIYDGSITNWNDSAICKLNPAIVTVKKNSAGKVISSTCALPNTTVVPVFRADGSGTSYIFMDYLNQAAGTSFAITSGSGNSANKALGTQIFPNTTFNQGQVPTAGLGAQKNAGVANNVEETEGAIGYVEYSYILLQKTLPAVQIVNAAGKTVSLSATSIAAGAGDFSATPPSEGTDGVVKNFSIVNGSGKGSYPIVGYSWAIVPQDFKTWNTGTKAAETLVAMFLDWATNSSAKGGQNTAQQQGYVPLPSYVRTLAASQIAQLKYDGTSIVLN